jgi:Arc/MetJ-type ribon-helix-helix transcriptional regulator
MQIEYHFGSVARVSTQIAVRLPDGMVEFLDQLVTQGQAPSRASVVERALAREFRRVIAARDAAILAEAAEGTDVPNVDPDLDRLAEYAARTPLDLE